MAAIGRRMTLWSFRRKSSACPPCPAPMSSLGRSCRAAFPAMAFIGSDPRGAESEDARKNPEHKKALSQCRRWPVFLVH